MACRFPDARSPVELWQNVLAGRAAFRAVPDERLPLADYGGGGLDRTDVRQAAVLSDLSLDRLALRVAASTWRATDPAHWLALTVAAEALADAGFADGEGLPRERTGVRLGNTLTGEFSRAQTLRLRWPYVRRVIEQELARDAGRDDSAATRALLARIETRFKAPFPPTGDESLAGGLSNTIAGRICNHFDLHGGGFTLDGACASSSLAIVDAARSLVSGELDLALAGGVDLSLDPFELAGFSAVGALAPNGAAMRVYDERAAGFLPGEGCGMVVLMRADDALGSGRPIQALLRGWGISSDGAGGLTRPDPDGHALALHRACERADIRPGEITLIEGHGTATAVGDAAELAALDSLRRSDDSSRTPAVLSSVKALVGHTKAAAGVASVIKTVMALREGVLPAAARCERPAATLRGPERRLQVLQRAEPWPADRPPLAGVSALAFGGLNTHLVLQRADAPATATRLSPDQARLARSHQDAELFLFRGADRDGLRRDVARVAAYAGRLSCAELGDLSAALLDALGTGPARAAVVARSAHELADKLTRLLEHLADDTSNDTTARSLAGIFSGQGHGAPRIGLAFSGQASPVRREGGVWARRFDDLAALHPADDDDQPPSTTSTQAALVTASLAGLDLLQHFSLQAELALGHSLGEWTALHWAGALSRHDLLRLVTLRGELMDNTDDPRGTMVGVEADPPATARWLDELALGPEVVIAAHNGPRQTAVSGPREALAQLVARAPAAGFAATLLPVEHAFHSPAMSAVVVPLAAALSATDLTRPRRPVCSTISGELLDDGSDLAGLLTRQVVSPVLFAEAVAAAGDVDLWIELGSGQVLAGLLNESAPSCALSVDALGESHAPWLCVLGTAFAAGAAFDTAALFRDRFRRPFALDWSPRFLVNPCEADGLASGDAELSSQGSPNPADNGARAELLDETSARSVVLRLVAQLTELPLSALSAEQSLLSDLHLNSIQVGQLVVEACRALHRPLPLAPTAYSEATLGGLAQALDELPVGNSGVPVDGPGPAGLDDACAPFVCEFLERPLPAAPSSTPAIEALHWTVLAADDHPLGAALRDALPQGDGAAGLVLCLPANSADGPPIEWLLEAVRALGELGEQAPVSRCLIVHEGNGAAFARCLRSEDVARSISAVSLAADDERALGWLLRELALEAPYSEARIDRDGVRRVPSWRAALGTVAADQAANADDLPLGSNDLLVVSGGGRGIAAECALALGRASGCCLGLLGRSDPAQDSAPNRELAANLARFEAAGLRWRYVVADVTDAAAVSVALDDLSAHFGRPVSGLLHGAGRNLPQRLGDLDREAFAATLAPKLAGLEHLLAAVEPSELRLLIGLGSLVAAAGLAGQCDYAVANEALVQRIERFAERHPRCRCLAPQWTVWAGVGMGERLGSVDALLHQGIVALPVERACSLLLSMLSRGDLPVAPLACGRLGRRDTLTLAASELPFLRFIERPRVDYPGLELIVDVALDLTSDPYLADHVLDGQPLLPAVLGLEAMVQAACALRGSERLPWLEELAFDAALQLLPEGSTTVRLCALARHAECVDVVLRSEVSDFTVDHFRVRCRFDRRPAAPAAEGPQRELAELPLQPAEALYDGWLFQSGRFARLEGYHQLSAHRALARVATPLPAATMAWFGRHLPARLLLGDPGRRDACLHALSACLPDDVLIPVAVERVEFFTSPNGPVLCDAQERHDDGRRLLWDLTLSTPEGRLVERWTGLLLTRLSRRPYENPAALLVGPRIERGATALLGAQTPRVALVRGHDNAVALAALGHDTPLLQRPDGRPELPGGPAVSFSHGAGLTLVVAAHGSPAASATQPLAVDMESVTPRTDALWAGLLGDDGMALAQRLVQTTSDDLHTAATRVWTARECLTKVGISPGTALTLRAAHDDGWVSFAAGSLTLAGTVLSVKGLSARLAVTLLACCDHAHV